MDLSSFLKKKYSKKLFSRKITVFSLEKKRMICEKIARFTRQDLFMVWSFIIFVKRSGEKTLISCIEIGLEMNFS